jgi:transcriptional regulator with XRE-family HTH domain
MNTVELNHQGVAPQHLISRLTPRDPERLTMSRSHHLQPVAARVRAARIAAGLTPAELAERAGRLTGTEIVNVEGGRRVPTLAVLADLARALNVPLHSLVEDIPPQLGEDDDRALRALAERLRALDPKVLQRALGLLQAMVRAAEENECQS